MAHARRETIKTLRSNIASIEDSLHHLKKQLAVLEAQESQTQITNGAQDGLREDAYHKELGSQRLDLEEYQRYGRQMIIPDFGLQGQLKLKNARVLIVGVGGLGSPAAAYLAGAGVGTLGLVDGDTVEISNLHRQTVHTSGRIGIPKVESAVKYLGKLNSKPCYVQYPFHLSSKNALDIFQGYDIIFDCTDHPTSRYLISDAAVLCKKLLITASATKTDGQLMTLDVWSDWPCYRCVFPKPPAPETVQSCSDSGILGPSVGVMGVLMAVEAIKAITQRSTFDSDSGLLWLERTAPPTLLLYSAYDTIPFRIIYLTKPRKDCAACSAHPTVTRESLESGSLDYAVFCGVSQPLDILPAECRISAKDFDSKINGHSRMIHPEEDHNKADTGVGDKSYVLVDVRESQDFDMCRINGSFNIPYSSIAKVAEDPDLLEPEHRQQNNALRPLNQLIDFVAMQDPKPEVYVICRYGNDSQKAVRFFLDHYEKNNSGFGLGKDPVLDIEGGLRAWSREVDPMFPEY